MDTNNKAVTKDVVETDTTQVAPPATEAQTINEQTTEKQVPAESVSKEVSDVSDQTEPVEPKDYQVQRLAEENRRLKEEKKARLANESAFNAFRPQVAPVSQPGVVRIEDYTDQLTGETNWNAYNQAQLQREQQVIQQAEWRAQQTTQDVLDENNARSKYPEVFSDPEVEQEVADRWFAAKMRGENPTISDIAERVSKRFQQAVSKAEKIGAEKMLNEVSAKEQATLEATGQNVNQTASSQDELDDLRLKTRVGNQDAITARIKAIPWANK